MSTTNHLDEIDEIDKIDEIDEIFKITLLYTTKANTFSLFCWWDPCDTSECQMGVR